MHVGDEVGVVSVNTGRRRLIGSRHGQEVWSAIAKRRLQSAMVEVRSLGIAGDERVSASHGGPEKAVYAYPSEHLPIWSEELGRVCAAGDFGENLTTSGCDETGVRVGDVWAWGEALLQVAQPRLPCYKLAMYLGTAAVIRRMERTGRFGWYMRVLRAGSAPFSGPITVAERGRAGMEVRAIRFADRITSDPATLAAIVDDPALGDEARRALSRRLASLRSAAA